MIYSVKANKALYRSIPLLLRMLGYNYEQDSVKRTKGLPIWQFLIGVSGSGNIIMDKNGYVLQPGQAFLFPPNIPHSYQSTGGKWVVHFVGFSGNSCQKILLDLRMHRPGLYQLKHEKLCLEHIECFRSVLEQHESDKNRSLSKELYAFLLDMSQNTFEDHTASSQQDGLISEITLYLEDHYAEDISLADLSEQFSRTPEYLCTRFREEKGETIIKYLTRIRIGHARWMILENPDLSVSEVGRLCGFRSPSYFGKVFRDYTGMTPKACVKNYM